jgi:hypothetical protein
MRACLSPSFDDSNNIWSANYEALLSFLPRRAKYSPPGLEHRQAIFHTTGSRNKAAHEEQNGLIAQRYTSNAVAV